MCCDSRHANQYNTAETATGHSTDKRQGTAYYTVLAGHSQRACVCQLITTNQPTSCLPNMACDCVYDTGVPASRLVAACWPLCSIARAAMQPDSAHTHQQEAQPLTAQHHSYHSHNARVTPSQTTTTVCGTAASPAARSAPPAERQQQQWQRPSGPQSCCQASAQCP